MRMTGKKKYHTKSPLKWHKLTKDGTGVKRYVRSVQGQENEGLVQLGCWGYKEMRCSRTVERCVIVE